MLEVDMLKTKATDTMMWKPQEIETFIEGRATHFISFEVYEQWEVQHDPLTRSVCTATREDSKIESTNTWAKTLLLA